MMVDSAGSSDEGFVLRIRISDNQTFLLDFQKDLIMLRHISDAWDKGCLKLVSYKWKRGDISEEESTYHIYPDALSRNREEVEFFLS